MEFITVEQFKEQPKEVQKVFLDWWKSNSSEVDLIGYVGKGEAYKESFPSLFRNIAINCFEIGVEIIPLFTEGQLRKFIEDKAECKVMIEYTSCENIVIKICIQDEVTGSLRYNRKLTFPNNKFDLINSYWKVACIIAKEEIV